MQYNRKAVEGRDYVGTSTHLSNPYEAVPIPSPNPIPPIKPPIHTLYTTYREKDHDDGNYEGRGDYDIYLDSNIYNGE